MQKRADTSRSVEILKGPASLMYGSDALAGVVILHPKPSLPEGEMQANVSSEYQTNNGLFAYSLSMAGNKKGFVWDARFSDKMAHAYNNKYGGHVRLPFHVSKGKSLFHALIVRPNHGKAVGSFLRPLVHDVVGKVEILRNNKTKILIEIFQRCKCSLFQKSL